MFYAGDIVEVMQYDKETRRMTWDNAYLMKVLDSQYRAGQFPELEFVGVALTGKFEGSTMAILNSNARLHKTVEGQ